jgi:neutral ceramidase
MKSFHRFAVLILSIAAVSSVASEAQFRAGFTTRDITPGIGTEKPGGYGKSYNRYLHDPCKVRVAVFDDGKESVALVGIDSLAVPRELVLEARAAITKRCGIPGSHVLVGASHSHSSGPVGMIQPGQFDHASPLVRKLAYEDSSLADADYLRDLQQAIVDGVCSAYERRQEARCAFASGHEDKVAFNRRLRMKNGLTFSHPGTMNPDVVDYAGPIDPEVGVIAAYDTEDKLLGVIVNYACHATTSPGGISANWIYYLEQTIQGALQTPAPVVFLQGACGDITQVDNLTQYARPAPERWARQVGGRVGAEAVRTILLAEPGGNIPISARQRVWKIARRRPSSEHLKRSLEIVSKDSAKTPGHDRIFAKEIVLLDALIASEPEVEVEVQAIQVGPAVFVSNPAEFFVNLGLEIKSGSLFPFTFPVELANGCTGYVPTEEAFSSAGGGYETRLTSYSNLEITAGTQMVQAGIALTKLLKPGPVPKPPPARQGSPWVYGNVAPQRQ